MSFLRSETTQKVVGTLIGPLRAPVLTFVTFTHPEIFWLTRVVVASLFGLICRYCNSYLTKHYLERAFPNGFSKLRLFISEFIYLSGFVFLISIIAPKLHNENIFVLLMIIICAGCILLGHPLRCLTSGQKHNEKLSKN